MGFQDTHTKNKSMGRIRSDRGPSRTTLQPVRVSRKPERHENEPPIRPLDDSRPQEAAPPAASPPYPLPQEPGGAAGFLEPDAGGMSIELQAEVMTSTDPVPWILPPWPPEVPSDILADPIPICGDCGRESVVKGQPGRPDGLCFQCWMKGNSA